MAACISRQCSRDSCQLMQHTCRSRADRERREARAHSGKEGGRRERDTQAAPAPERSHQAAHVCEMGNNMQTHRQAGYSRAHTHMRRRSRSRRSSSSRAGQHRSEHVPLTAAAVRAVSDQVGRRARPAAHRPRRRRNRLLPDGPPRPALPASHPLATRLSCLVRPAAANRRWARTRVQRRPRGAGGAVAGAAGAAAAQGGRPKGGARKITIEGAVLLRWNGGQPQLEPVPPLPPPASPCIPLVLGPLVH